MVLLDTNETILKLIGICSYTLNDSFSTKLKNAAKTALLLIIFCYISIFTSGKYVIENLGDMTKCNSALFQVAVAFAATTSTITIAFNQRKVKKIIDEIRILVDKHKDTVSSGIYDYAESRARYISVHYFSLICFSFFFGVEFVAFSSIVRQYIEDGYFDPAKWYEPYKVSVPMDKATTAGYFFMLFIDTTAPLEFIFLQSAVFTFFVSYGLFLQACCFRIRCYYNEIDVLTENLSSSRKLKMKAIIVKIVKLHIRLKELFVELAEIMSGTIFFALLSGILFVATTVYEFESRAKQLDVGLLLTMVGLVDSVGTLLVYSYVGSTLSENFLELADYAYESMWYKNDNTMKKYLLIIMPSCHKPLYFDGFKMVNLTLATFSRVMNSSLSCYLMFKRLANR